MKKKIKIYLIFFFFTFWKGWKKRRHYSQEWGSFICGRFLTFLLCIPYLLNIFLWTSAYVILSLANISLWKVFHFTKPNRLQKVLISFLRLFFQMSQYPKGTKKKVTERRFPSLNNSSKRNFRKKYVSKFLIKRLFCLNMGEYAVSLS